MTDERRYRIDLRYLGAPFEGWQSQPAGTAVQDHLERALATILRHPVRVTGSARTDSGVHAEHQVATFATAVPMALERWHKSLHGLLHEAIGVTAIAPVEGDFHPILSAKGKVYCYRIWRGTTRDPFAAPLCWRHYGPLDVAAMRQEAQALVGLHDFTSFCATDSGAKTRERRVVEIELVERGALLELWVLGEGFLKQMVRTIVGTLVDVGAGRLERGAVARILAARDRKAGGMTAAAHGLTLVRVLYDRLEPLAELRRAREATGLVLGG
jgi:tRNA pseudouridine38-40 synthase